MDSKQHNLTATNLATFHHFNCNLYLHNVYNRTGDGTATGLEHSKELSNAQTQRGNDWETRLLSWLDDQNLLLTVPTVPMTGEELTENLLFDDRDHFFVAGFCFWPPQDNLNLVYRELGHKPVQFGLARLDLLEITRVGKDFQWRVVDAKASGSVKTSHHVQIYFYSLCLQHLFPKSIFQPSTTAAVWLPPSEGFDTAVPSLEDLKVIKLSLLAPPLDNFLFRRLPQILNLPRHSVSWHYNPGCVGCPYTASCSRRSIKDGELGSMSNISFGQARALRNLLSIWRDENTHRNGAKDATDIEDLHTLFEERDSVQKLSVSNPITMRKAKRILALPIRERNRSLPLQSPLVESARTRTVQLIQRRNYTCPKTEDVAIILTLVSDPSTPTVNIVSFCISTFTSLSSIQVPSHCYGIGKDLIPSLARLIEAIISAGESPPSTQFYVFSASENSALQSHLIEAALEDPGHGEDTRICIGALAQGASLLQTTFQPEVMSGGRGLDFLKTKQRRKDELIACLERMGLPTEGSTEQLRKRVYDQLSRYQASRKDESRQKEFGQLPHVVVVKSEIERSLVLPIPGFWDLPDCLQMLVSPRRGVRCPTDEELYVAFKGGLSMESLLETRNQSIFTVLCSFRKRLLDSGLNLLVNVARPLSVNFMDLCREEKLRKLFFMQQFEVLSRLTELWNSRIEGCPDAPILEYRSARSGQLGLEYVFHLKSGVVETPNSDKIKSFFDYILTPDFEDDLNELPTEALFDDLSVSGLLFPLTQVLTKSRWEEVQHPKVQKNLHVVDVRDMQVVEEHTEVILSAWCSDWQNMKFVEGKYYRLSPRLVDFNTSKVLTALFELDLRHERGEPVPFLQLVLDPNSFRVNTNQDSAASIEASRKVANKLQSLFKQLKGLGIEGATPLHLMASQNKAAQHILANRLSVIWGPPGTGKTHTLALSLLRLLNVQYNLGGRSDKVVFITAMTHAAIDALREKLSYLKECHRAIESLPTEWLDGIREEHVVSGSKHPKRSSNGITIYTGTVYQLFNLCKAQSQIQADILLIDEAGQVSLTAASLVIRSLAPNGKVIVAGDQEQLSPILAAQYPRLKSGPLFGSILDCLVHFSRRIRRENQSSILLQNEEELDDIYSSQGSVVQLTENFRLNPDLGEFISTIYSRPFIPQKVQARQLAAALNRVAHDMGKNFVGLDDFIVEHVQFFFLALSSVMSRQPQSFLTQPTVQHTKSNHLSKNIDVDNTFNPLSLALLRLENDGQTQEVSYEMHIKAEAMLAVALILHLQRCSPNEDIFVATPHRVQRQAVKAALETAKLADPLEEAMERLSLGNDQAQEGTGKVTVDTVERLQGSEAAFVICLFSLPASESHNLKFLLERRRLNVAISRAKSLCILISSSEVLRPPVEILADAESAKGYAFLKAYEERSWSAEIRVDMGRL